jgi:hypothetical protein
MGFRVYVAFFSFLIALISGCLIPVAYFGDKNVAWAKRLAIISFVAALAFLFGVFW